MNEAEGNTLSRGLKNRHIQLIALGGAIGTGLFLGTSTAIGLAGPSMLLGYAVAGVIAFLIMRQLGEMVVEEPVAGSFSHFAFRYWSDFAGFLSGWNYWALYVLVSMAELTAIGIYVQYWWPEIPVWASALAFFVLVNGINMLHVRLFGEMEFWLSTIKVTAIIAMIGFGAWLLASGSGGPDASISNLWDRGGFFPNGVGGLLMAMAVIMFSFGGLELVGITAAEADDPGRTIPKATNQIIYRILIFYIGALGVLLALYPWDLVEEGSSPFVMIFHSLDATAVATVLNVVVLTAALSVYNSCVYCNSRMLYGLALQGNAPKSLTRVNRRGVPVAALAVSAAATAAVVAINFFMPEGAFGMLMLLVVAALVINWAMISITHLMFRRRMRAEGRSPAFPSPGAPVTNVLCLVFLAGILVVMWFTPGIRTAILLMPAWLLVLSAMYWLRKRQGGGRPAAPQAESS
ncbi:amino acid permease [Luteimonas dalianensis]|uniref:amino acid permease n=1 Tax=Luteimonas dalianensis TaxID=1148196 RepID=UPI003BF170CB